MSLTTSPSAAGRITGSAVLQLKSAQRKPQINHFAGTISPDPTRNPERKPLQLNPITAIAAGSCRRREASATLAGLCLVSALEPFFLFLPPTAFASGEQAESPECRLTVAPSGLAFCDRVVGSGAEAARGQLIKAHYVGRLENGKVFDSSYARGKPLTFRVGVGEVIKGWDQGILGGEGIPPMLPGGKRTLKLPPELGYGIRGAGCRGGRLSSPFFAAFIEFELV
ncbi:Peptidyl-prolyl cis-trans isomerase FKBP13, chloroplastic [Apostasia shenzhenica]|uniref:peptidylprolyl isomerase n=1 Tax=Apostasia shenzhenica TaxID=1088818 RepID=A0A2I0B2W7_9ASPA|nr:Peptidyl-prolyl cis-trans isomerase FKBP13, chloroplastic [Apostasia shenzhenica]